MITLQHYRISNYSAVLLIAGTLDTQTCRKIEGPLWTLLNHYAGLNVVMDLSRVEFLSSYAVGCLVEACGTVTGYGGQLSLAQPQPQVYDALYLNGADLVMPVYETYQEAIAHSQQLYIRQGRRPYNQNRSARV